MYPDTSVLSHQCQGKVNLTVVNCMKKTFIIVHSHSSFINPDQHSLTKINLHSFRHTIEKTCMVKGRHSPITPCPLPLTLITPRVANTHHGYLALHTGCFDVHLMTDIDRICHNKDKHNKCLPYLIALHKAVKHEQAFHRNTSKQQGARQTILRNKIYNNVTKH